MHSRKPVKGQRQRQTADASSLIGAVDQAPQWGEKALDNAAYKGRLGSPTSAAHILCGHIPVQPGREAMVELQELMAMQVPQSEEAAMQAQRDMGAEAG